MTTINIAKTKVIPHSKSRELVLGDLGKFRNDTLSFLQEIALNDSSIVETRMAHFKVVFLSSPAYAQQVLQRRSRKYIRDKRFRNVVQSWVGVNLFTSELPEWLRLRRMMQPAFHRRQIAQFGEMIVRETGAHLARMTENPDVSIEIESSMMDLSMQIIGRALFNVDMSQGEQKMREAFGVASRHVIYRALNPLSAPLWVPTRQNRVFEAAVNTLCGRIREIIEQRQHQETPEHDFLDMLLAAHDEENGSCLSMEQLINEIQGIVFAGHETTGQTLAWAWYLLSQHPEVLTRLRSELKNTLNGRPPTIDDLPQLPYTLQILQETMRLYPVAWSYSREALDDDEIDGYPIPKGRKIVINTYGIQRNPDYWIDPNKFDPDRFSPEGIMGQEKFAFLPFSAGPRRCIGEQFFYLEARLILATIAQKYDLRLLPNQEIKPVANFILQAAEGIHMMPKAYSEMVK